MLNDYEAYPGIPDCLYQHYCIIQLCLIQTCHHLIQQEQLGPSSERPGNLQPLPVHQAQHSRNAHLFIYQTGKNQDLF